MTIDARCVTAVIRDSTMSKVTIYTTKLCPYCFAAKRLLKTKGVSFDEIDVTFSPGQRAEMTERAGGRRTVPQIFIGNRHIGGFDDLNALERTGGLDGLFEATEA